MYKGITAEEARKLADQNKLKEPSGAPTTIQNVAIIVTYLEKEIGKAATADPPLRKLDLPFQGVRMIIPQGRRRLALEILESRGFKVDFSYQKEKISW